jgi:glucokinase
MGEYWRGAGRGARSMIYVSVSTGVAAGLIFGGILYRGVSMSEGQLGHVAIEPNGPLCACGSRGCLQLFASAAALLSEARARARAQADSLLYTLCEGDLSRLTVADVGRAAAADDRAACAAVASIGRYLGIGVAHLVSLLNPDVIVLGGPVLRVVPSVIQAVRREVDSRAFPVPAAAVRIVQAELGADAIGVGAAALLITEWRRSAIHAPADAPVAIAELAP